VAVEAGGTGGRRSGLQYVPGLGKNRPQGFSFYQCPNQRHHTAQPILGQEFPQQAPSQNAGAFTIGEVGHPPLSRPMTGALRWQSCAPQPPRVQNQGRQKNSFVSPRDMPSCLRQLMICGTFQSGQPPRTKGPMRGAAPRGNPGRCWAGPPQHWHNGRKP
jgi:hypothetical protein